MIPNDLYEPCPPGNQNICYIKIKIIIVIVYLLSALLVPGISYFILGDVNMPLSVTNRTWQQQKKKGIEDLNNAIKKFDLMD